MNVTGRFDVTPTTTNQHALAEQFEGLLLRGGGEREERQVVLPTACLDRLGQPVLGVTCRLLGLGVGLLRLRENFLTVQAREHGFEVFGGLA